MMEKPFKQSYENPNDVDKLIFFFLIFTHPLDYCTMKLSESKVTLQWKPIGAYRFLLITSS